MKVSSPDPRLTRANTNFIESVFKKKIKGYYLKPGISFTQQLRSQIGEKVLGFNSTTQSGFKNLSVGKKKSKSLNASKKDLAKVPADQNESNQPAVIK